MIIERRPVSRFDPEHDGPIDTGTRSLQAFALIRRDFSFAILAGADLSRIRTNGIPALTDRQREMLAEGGPDRHDNSIFTHTAEYHMPGFDFWGADLSGADLREADLSSANLVLANLKGADLRGADLRGAMIANANLEGANLTSAMLDGARISSCNLRKAKLREASLARINAWGCDLQEADLTGADVLEARFGSECFMHGAILADLVRLPGIQRIGKYDESTAWSPGITPPPSEGSYPHNAR
jgi:uncharacterized protein YjbI with pentapeptide repeats